MLWSSTLSFDSTTNCFCSSGLFQKNKGLFSKGIAWWVMVDDPFSSFGPEVLICMSALMCLKANFISFLTTDIYFFVFSVKQENGSMFLPRNLLHILYNIPCKIPRCRMKSLSHLFLIKSSILRDSSSSSSSPLLLFIFAVFDSKNYSYSSQESSVCMLPSNRLLLKIHTRCHHQIIISPLPFKLTWNCRDVYLMREVLT